MPVSHFLLVYRMMSHCLLMLDNRPSKQWTAMWNWHKKAEGTANQIHGKPIKFIIGTKVWKRTSFGRKKKGDRWFGPVHVQLHQEKRFRQFLMVDISYPQKLSSDNQQLLRVWVLVTFVHHLTLLSFLSKFQHCQASMTLLLHPLKANSEVVASVKSSPKSTCMPAYGQSNFSSAAILT